MIIFDVPSVVKTVASSHDFANHVIAISVSNNMKSMGVKVCDFGAGVAKCQLIDIARN
jgi:hypothetical protein